MIIKSWLKPIDLYICKEEVPDQYDLSSVIEQKAINFEGTSAQRLSSRQVKTDGLFVIDTYIQHQCKVWDLFEIKGEHIMLSFHMTGKANGNFENFMDQFNLKGNIHNIFYAPGCKSEIEMKPFLQHNYFCIILSKDFYFHLMTEGLNLHKDFARSILDKVPTCLSSHWLSSTPQMKNAIQDIRRCNRQGEYKRVYLEAKIKELILLQFEQFQTKVTATSLHHILRCDEEDKIHLAREILEADIQNPPNIKNLSKLISLNEFKLKNGFKACYNITIRQYIIQLRMAKAKALLDEQKYTVGEIAAILGYKSTAHFSQAFKTYYNHLPSESMV